MNMRALLIIIFAGCAWAQKPGCLIQPQSVGPVHAGMTAAQVRQTLRGVTLKPSEDADRLPTLIVIREGLHTMDLYLDSARDKVQTIRVYDETCATRDGVHPGMSLPDAAARYGRLRTLRVTNTESREFAEFERQPDWLEIQVGNGNAGIYPPGQRSTTNYSSGAHIASLWVHPNKR